jgi:methylenetetrahydrofolate dehydrogenase (NADP+) / methenyltetrahydrofolate cyclohydrolase
MKKHLLSFILLFCMFQAYGIAHDNSVSGTKVAAQRKEKLKEKFEDAHLERAPHLAIIQVEDDDASKSVYIRRKIQACKQMGFDVTHRQLPSNTTQEELERLIASLNNDEKIDGMIVQLPLPPTFDQWKIIDAIVPGKDVDGLTSTNMGNLKRKSQCSIKPATAKGIVTLLKHYGIDPHGKECVIIGGSELVGHPLQVLLSREDEGINIGGATVTLCHKETRDLKKHTREADIVIVAVGCPHLITEDMVKKGAVVVDAGISRQGKKIVGDVAFDEVAPKCSAITPVPGGVGPMTVVSLLENLFKATMQARGRVNHKP